MSGLGEAVIIAPRLVVHRYLQHPDAGVGDRGLSEAPVWRVVVDVGAVRPLEKVQPGMVAA